MAHAYLGSMYAQGEGVPKNATEAAKWYRMAAADSKDHLIIVPQYKLGNMYAAGDGVPRDSAEAARWYRIAAERGHGAAQRALGMMYVNGEGVPTNEVEGLAWIMVATGSGTNVIRQHRQQREDIEGRLSPEFVSRARQRSQELSAQVYRNRKGNPSPPDLDKE